MVRTLPKGWKRVALGDVCEVNPRADALKGVDQISFVAMADTSESGHLMTQTIVPYSKKAVAGYTRFRRGDILCAKITPCFENGKGALTDNLEMPQGIGSTEFHVIRTGDRVLPEIAHAVVQSTKFRRRGELWMTGSAGQKRVPADFIAEYEMDLPPLDEQRRIVRVLDVADRLIRVERARTENLYQLRRAVVSRSINRANAGRAKKLALSTLVDVRMSGVDKKTIADESAVLLCNYMDVFYNEVINKEVDFMRASATQTEIDRFTLRQGDLLLTKDSEVADEIAECAVVESDLPGVLCGYHLALLRPEKKRVLGEYLAIALRDPHVRHQFARCANGVTRFGLTLDAFDQIEVALPGLKEQQKVAEIYATISKRINASNKLAEQLVERKRGLMQKLLIGKQRLTRDLPGMDASHV